MPNKPIAKCQMEAPIYSELLAPQGFLELTRESHALWFYYTAARNAYDTLVVDPIVMEGEKDPTTNFRQLFISTARLYNVEPEAMAKCWPQINMQCLALGFPELPDEERYRFDNRLTIN